MHYVLSALTLRPMSQAAHSRLLNRVSHWVSVFAGNAMSSAQSASVIVCASASFLCQLETVFVHLIYRHSKYLVSANDEQVWDLCVSL